MTSDTTRRSQDAQDFYSQIFSPAYEALRRAASQTPLVIMLWGPRKRTRSWSLKRQQIREELQRLGHTVYFSEQIGVSPTALTKKGVEFLQSETADVIVVLQSSYDYVGAVHHFVDMRVADAKMVLFVDEAAPDERLYHRALIELEHAYHNVGAYKYPDDLVRGRLLTGIVEKISALQMVKYRAIQRARSWGLRLEEAELDSSLVRGPLQPFRYNLLELYHEHHDEIEVLTDSIALFFLAYVNHRRRVSVNELIHDVGLAEDSLLKELAPLFRGEMMLRSGGVLSVTGFGRRMLDGLGLLVPPAPIVRPQASAWLRPRLAALAGGAGLSLAGAALLLLTLLYGTYVTQNQQPLAVTPARQEIVTPTYTPLPLFPTPFPEDR